MNQSMQPAIQHLFQAPTLEDVSREQLEGMIEEYPCFGFGHYLLSRKLMAGDGERFLATTQRTSLYFSNPFWLQWLLEHASGTAATRMTPGRHAGESPHAPDSHVEISGVPPLPEPEMPPPPAATSQPDEAWPEMNNPGRSADTDALLEDPQSPGQIGGDSAAELLMDSIEKAKELRESLQKINEDFVARTGHPILGREPELFDPAPATADSSPATADPVPATADSSATPQEPIQDEEPPFVLDEPELAPGPAAEPTAKPTVEPTAAPTAAPAVAPIAAEPLFEPLHTIDYFASQGIKLVLEENPTDQLGRQLKSFTEWLRVMRRLPQRDREIIPDRVAEQAVQNFAAHSIEGKEPVTETMAEVLIKQGMPERARIVYEKLSLLDPDKSAYFAAKIEQLNSR